MRFYLPHKKPGEKIILLVRRHPIIIIFKIAFWTLLSIFPPIAYLFFKDFNLVFLQNGLMSVLMIIFLGTFYLLVWLFMLNSFVDYFLDVWVVTSERIINIEQNQLFNRTTSEQDLSKIQDVTAEIRGILPTFLDYGEVFVQTAGEEARFIFKQVPHPLEVKRKITTLCEDRKIRLESEKNNGSSGKSPNSAL